MLLLTLDSQGRLQLPPEALQRIGLSAGAKVSVENKGDEITIRSASIFTKRRSMKDLAGFLGSDPKALRTLMEERRADSEKERGQSRS